MLIFVLVFLFFQLLLNFPSYADMDENSDLRTLTVGVNQISSPGIPGNISVFGPNAFGIIQDKRGQVVVAGAKYYTGRVLLWGHDGFFNKNSIESADTGRLLINSIKWASRKPKPKVGVVDNPYLVSYLDNLGFQTRPIKIDNFAAVDVLIGGIEKASKNQQVKINHWLKQGGSIIDSATGWGWQQLNPDQQLCTDFTGNVFYAPVGLVFADGFTSDTIQDGFLAQPLPSSSTNAYFALDSLVQKAWDQSKISDQEILILSNTLTTATNCVPIGDQVFRPKLEKVLGGDINQQNPSPDEPITERDILQRLAMSEEIRQSRRLAAEDIKAHSSAKIFPGISPVGTPPVKRSVKVDTSIVGWHSLGLFADAGQMIHVYLPPTAVGKKLKIRMGSTTCRLWNKSVWNRAPEITNEWSLTQPETRIASSFGGLIYIVVTEATHDGPRTVTINGAVESPYYKLGRTSLQDWVQRIRYLPAPWAELASDKVILTVPSSEVRELDNPELLMQTWDRVLDLSADLAVLSKTRDYPQRYCADVQLCAGWMHAGNPIMIPSVTAKNLVDSNHLINEGDWGFYHETGHMFQNPDWTFEGTGEVTVNLFTMYILDKLCNIKPEMGRMGQPNIERKYRAYFKEGSQFKQWKSDPFLALYMYYQLQQEFGWKAFKNVFAQYHKLSRSQRPKNDQEKRDQWMFFFSKVAKQNLGPFFQLWGIPISESSQESVSNLPIWLPIGFPPKE